MLDVLITNGQVVTDGCELSADVGIADGRVVYLGAHGAAEEAREVVDASGFVVMPGAIDAHFHTQTGAAYFSTRADDMHSATRSAVSGGITTVVPFVWGDSGQPVKSYLGEFLELGQDLSICDFAVHCGLRPEMDVIRQLPDAFNLGVTTFKMHYDYRKTGQGRMSDDDHRMAAMRLIAESGGMAMFHCENGYVIDYLEDEFIESGDRSWKAFLASRPNETEAEAVRRSIFLSELTDCPVYVVHLSSSEGLREIVKARARGVRVGTETCPQYLTLTGDDMEKWGVLAKIGPPLRSRADQEALWNGLAMGQISVIGSDHSAQTLDHKYGQGDDYFLAPFGTPIIDVMLPVTYTAGVAEQRITLANFVDAFTRGPARMFGLYPRKGTLLPGSDADIVLWDPEARWDIRGDDLENPAGYSVFEGMEVQGRARSVWRRGELVFHDGEVLANGGTGKFLPRDRKVVQM